MDIDIREYRNADAEDLANLLWESVRNGTDDHYSAEERYAWASSVPDAEVFGARLASKITLVAEDSAGVAGFMTLEPDGHIDLAYVRSDLIGKGVAGRLYSKLEAIAKKKGIKSLYSEASHLAKSFFEKNGWSLIKTQQVESSGGQLLTNHRMKKYLK